MNDTKQLLALLAPLAPINPDALLGLHMEPASVLSDFGEVFGTKRLAVLHPNNSARCKAHTSIIGPLDETYPLLRAVNARFDFVVATPPRGEAWPVAGLSIPEQTGVLRRLAGGSNTINSVYACWLMANDLLTPAGEGMIIADATALRTAVANCPLASRIWFWLELPGGKLCAYFGAKHRCVLAPAATAREFDAKRHRFNGERVQSKSGNATRSSMDRFGMARAEYLRIKSDSFPPHVEIDSQGRFRCQVSGFDRVSGRVPPKISDALTALHGKRPLDFVQQIAALRELRQTLAAPCLRVAPDVVPKLDAAEQEHAMAGTPFNRPTNAQSVAWLDTASRVRCSTNFFGFRAGEDYSVTSRMFEGVKNELRRHVDGTRETVEVSGLEMAIIVEDALGVKHAFTQHPLSATSKGYLSVDQGHQLTDLLANFAMPQVPDVMDRDPLRFNQLVKRLLQLEKAPAKGDPIDNALDELSKISV